MDKPLISRPDRLADLLVWIEQNLDPPLTLETIAARAGLSPYHFSRLFSARMGRSVMMHVRGRRLIKAARRLTADPETQLIDLAFDSGFESQEAFTRAFGRLFGVSPGRFRHGFSVTPLEGQYPMTMPDEADVAVAQLPELPRLDAFTVAGPASRFNDATKANIPQLWSRLIGALPFEGQEPSWATYGVVWGVDAAEGSFDYLAGVRVASGASLPPGFTTIDIPAATYAVFRITLNGGPLHPQVKAAMTRIWGEMVPQAGLKVARSPDFEFYDGRFAPDRPGAVIDFHLPVETG